MNTPQTILITGGAGFIGSHVVRRFVRNYPHYRVVNLDALTYAGNLENLSDLAEATNYTFVKADIRNPKEVREVFDAYQPTGVIHLAAESHVDRSIEAPLDFVETNVLGTLHLLEAARGAWGGGDSSKHRFYHVSTDEVYGALPYDGGSFTEETRYDPHSPYSASKASSDHFVRAYGTTYGLPVVISNCSNNYGPNQFPEKLIPLMVRNIRLGRELPVYGKGENVRDWLYVEDHASAIDCIFHKARVGETYNIGGNCERTNIQVVHKLIEVTDRLLGRAEGTSLPLIRWVKDRAGHDARYAIDASRIASELGWRPSMTFEEGIERTVEWYLRNNEWLERIASGEYATYYQRMYGNR